MSTISGCTAQGQAFDPKYRGVVKILGWAVDIDTHEAVISISTIRRRHQQRLKRPVSRATVFRHLHDLHPRHSADRGPVLGQRADRRGSLYRVNFGLVIKNGQVVSHGFGAPPYSLRAPRLIHALRRGGLGLNIGRTEPVRNHLAALDHEAEVEHRAGTSPTAVVPVLGLDLHDAGGLEIVQVPGRGRPADRPLQPLLVPPPGWCRR